MHAAEQHVIQGTGSGRDVGDDTFPDPIALLDEVVQALPMETPAFAQAASNEHVIEFGADDLVGDGAFAENGEDVSVVSFEAVAWVYEDDYAS